MMTRTLIPSLLAVLAVLAAGGCAGRGGEGLSVSFDVEELPPAPPPPPEPAYVPPPPPPPPPDPAILRQQRIDELNAQMQPVYFDSGSWEISAEATSTLQSAAALLGSIGPFEVTLEGHTDGRGSEGYNHWLGLWRSKSVKDALRELGMDPDHFSLVTRGADAPAAEPGPDGEQPLNRRVELIVTSID